jgi:hypothetical protein
VSAALAAVVAHERYASLDVEQTAVDGRRDLMLRAVALLAQAMHEDAAARRRRRANAA